jgi:hypothetical protein
MADDFFTPDSADDFFVAEAAKPQMPERNVSRSPLASTVVGAGQGLTAGLAKYPLAGIAMIGDRLRNPNASQPLDWETAKKLVSAETGAYQEANPGSYTAGNIVGAIASPVGNVGRAVKGASTAAAVGRGALSGATYGGVNAYSGNEDLGEAAAGALTGGTIGGLVPGVARGAQGIVDKMSSGNSFDRLRQALATSDVTAVRKIMGLKEPTGSAAAQATKNMRMMQEAAGLLQHAEQTGFPANTYGLKPASWGEAAKQGASDVMTAPNVVSAKAAAAKAFGQKLADYPSGWQLLNPNSVLPGNVYGNVVGHAPTTFAEGAGRVGTGLVNAATGALTQKAPSTLQEANQALFEMLGR